MVCLTLKHLLWNFIYGMCMVYKIYGNGDRTDVLVNRLHVGQSKVYSWQGQDIFSSLNHPDRFWGPLSFYFKGTGVLSLGVKQPGCEVTTRFHIILKSRMSIATPLLSLLYVLMVWTATTLLS